MMRGHRMRVLAVDDSAVMRAALRTLFELHASDGDPALPAMELCGLTKDGIEALEAVTRLKPDVLVLDMEMPRLNGLGVLERLRTLAPGLPVIMCSAHTERGARSTLDALAAGAKDYVMKPGQQRDFASALDALMQQLLPKIAALGYKPAHVELVAAPPYPMTGRQARVEVLVIGVSTGGPSALETMLPALGADLRVPVLIVQHMPKLFTGALADRLNRLCRMPVVQANDGERVSAGKVWLAPGDAHMEVTRAAGEVRVRLHQGPPLNSCRPSVDSLFQSASRVYGAGTLALMMTGMGADGLDGTRAVHAAGGSVLAQDEATSAVWGMPGRVVQSGLATMVVALPDLAGAVLERVNGAEASRKPRPLIVRQEVLHGMY